MNVGDFTVAPAAEEIVMSFWKCIEKKNKDEKLWQAIV